MAPELGTLYGIGVGPGDPDLITVKALKILKSVCRIFAASSSKNDYSLALSIVSEHINDAHVENMAFPMTSDRALLQQSWESNARRVIEVLEKGEDIAFITLGDPLTYSTFTYLLRSLNGMLPQAKTVIIPGITSYHAAAALAATPLTEGEESFHLISGAKGGAKLRKIIETSENIVMLKTYRHFDDIYETLEELDLLDRALCLSRCGLDGEAVVNDIRSLKGKKLPYLSLIIIKKRGLGF